MSGRLITSLKDLFSRTTITMCSGAHDAANPAAAATEAANPAKMARNRLRRPEVGLNTLIESGSMSNPRDGRSTHQGRRPAGAGYAIPAPLSKSFTVGAGPTGIRQPKGSNFNTLRYRARLVLKQRRWAIL